MRWYFYAMGEAGFSGRKKAVRVAPCTRLLFPFHSPIAVRGLDAGMSDRGGIGQGSDQTDDADSNQKSTWHSASWKESHAAGELRLKVDEPLRPLVQLWRLWFPASPRLFHPVATARSRIVRRSADRLIRVARHLQTRLLAIALGLPLTVRYLRLQHARHTVVQTVARSDTVDVESDQPTYKRRHATLHFLSFKNRRWSITLRKKPATEPQFPNPLCTLTELAIGYMSLVGW